MFAHVHVFVKGRFNNPHRHPDQVQGLSLIDYL